MPQPWRGRLVSGAGHPPARRSELKREEKVGRPGAAAKLRGCAAASPPSSQNPSKRLLGSQHGSRLPSSLLQPRVLEGQPVDLGLEAVLRQRLWGVGRGLRLALVALLLREEQRVDLTSANGWLAPSLILR